ncbi:unnamed protein product [Urochloa humidicola]
MIPASVRPRPLAPQAADADPDASVLALLTYIPAPNLMERGAGEEVACECRDLINLRVKMMNMPYSDFLEEIAGSHVDGSSKYKVQHADKRHIFRYT